MITATDVWDNLDEYVRTVPSPALKLDHLTEMLAELFDIEELDPEMPKQPHVVDEYAILRSHIKSWLEKGGQL